MSVHGLTGVIRCSHMQLPRPLVAYFRVSTRRQGQSGLALDAQRAAVAAYVQQTGATLCAEFQEVESGRKVRRPQLTRALMECRARGAVLVIAKLDRLARNVAFLSALMDGDVEFLALDLPGASRFTLHILSAVAEQEARDISRRTKAASAIAKQRGVKLGAPQNLTDEARRRSIEVRQGDMADRNIVVRPLVEAWSKEHGMTLQKIADRLTEHRIPTPRLKGNRWHAEQVARVLRMARLPVASSPSIH